jgi:hypothetical protein
LAVGAGEAQFRRGDADFVVEVEQTAGFGDREKPCGLVAANAEGMRQAGGQVDEAASVQLVVLVSGAVVHLAAEEVEGLGLAGVAVQRRGLTNNHRSPLSASARGQLGRGARGRW